MSFFGKRFKTIALITLLSLSTVGALTACGTQRGSINITETKEAKLDFTECENNFDGLCKFLEGNGGITGDYIEMQAQVIGATEGRKYGFTFDGNEVTCELYYFDLDAGAKIDERYIKDIEGEQTITILEGTTPLKVFISDNEKYLMIYSDSDIEKAGHEAQKDKIERLINEFYRV